MIISTRYNLIVSVLLLLIIYSCNSGKENQKIHLDEHESLNEDSIELAQAYKLQSLITDSVQAMIETEAVDANSMDDAADDPAIWMNRQNPENSLVFGSNKKGGLVACNLKGETLKYYEIGKVNNVDVIYDFMHQDSLITLLGCSNRSTQAINLFKVNPEGTLTEFQDTSYLMDTARVDDIYGFCFGFDTTKNKAYAFVNAKNGLMIQYEIISNKDSILLKEVRAIQFNSQTEGMVVDSKNGNLFVGEEDAGVWVLNVDPNDESKSLITESSESNENIKYDIEGLTIIYQDSLSYLIVSSQGNFSYAAYKLSNDFKYIGSFKISDGKTVDGVEETDGIDAISDSLSVQFPKGLFVAQDGFNYTQDTLEAQNFKYVDLREILHMLESNK